MYIFKVVLFLILFLSVVFLVVTHPAAKDIVSSVGGNASYAMAIK